MLVHLYNNRSLGVPRSGAKERQTSLYLANHLLSNHTCANCLIWKTSVNYVSDLSRRDKCSSKLKNKIIIKIIINRLLCASDKSSLYNPHFFPDRNDTSIVSKG